jgi:hypothetical protein
MRIGAARRSRHLLVEKQYFPEIRNGFTLIRPESHGARVVFKIAPGRGVGDSTRLELVQTSKVCERVCATWC